MSKKDCLKKAEEHEKSNATYGLFVASYYYFAAHDFNKMLDVLREYQKYLNDTTTSWSKINKYLRVFTRYSSQEDFSIAHAILFDKKQVPDKYIENKDIHFIQNRLSQIETNTQRFLSFYITESPANFLKARDLLLE